MKCATLSDSHYCMWWLEDCRWFCSYTILPIDVQMHIPIDHTQTIGGFRGACPAHAPPRVPILSFLHTKFPKRNHLGSPRPPYEVHAPPTGNPGSATANAQNTQNIHKQNIWWTHEYTKIAKFSIGCFEYRLKADLLASRQVISVVLTDETVANKRKWTHTSCVRWC